MDQATAALLGALIGATTGKSGGVALEMYKRRRDRQGTASALAGEIASILYMTERRGHVAFFESLLPTLEAGNAVSVPSIAPGREFRDPVADRHLDRRPQAYRRRISRLAGSRAGYGCNNKRGHCGVEGGGNAWRRGRDRTSEHRPASLADMDGTSRAPYSVILWRGSHASCGLPPREHTRQSRPRAFWRRTEQPSRRDRARPDGCTPCARRSAGPEQWQHGRASSGQPAPTLSALSTQFPSHRRTAPRRVCHEVLSCLLVQRLGRMTGRYRSAAVQKVLQSETLHSRQGAGPGQCASSRKAATSGYTCLITIGFWINLNII